MGIKQWVGDRMGAVTGAMSFLQREEDRHQGGIRCIIETEVRDKTGKLISQREQVANSFNKSFWFVMQYIFVNASTVQPRIRVLDTANSEVEVMMTDLDAAGKWCDLAPANEDNYGILIGTSTTAWAWAQYDLQEKISHGGSTGEMSYGEYSRSVLENTGAPAKLVSQRSFDNNSGAEITVREIGWFGKIVSDATPYYHMIARDVITPTAVPNGGRLTVKYTIQINPT